MTLLGIGILWVSIANWGEQPSGYLLVTGITFIVLGGPQLYKYFLGEKKTQYQHTCLDCKHRWLER